MPSTLLIKNIGMLATAQGQEALKGKAQGSVTLLENAYVTVRDVFVVDFILRELQECEADLLGRRSHPFSIWWMAGA